MSKSPRIEREFGVPIPGEILEPEQWAKTALKKLPPEGPLDFAALFGRTAPIIVDLGCGNGRFLLGSAMQRPEMDHVGIDILPMVLRYATRRGNQRGLKNLRFAAIDAQRFVRQYLPPHGIREMHCYHPQPFHDSHEANRRLITPAFLTDVLRVLERGAPLYLQTDNLPYWEYMKSVLPTFFEFHEQPGPWPDAPKGRTRREIIALRRDYPVYRGWGTARADVTVEQAVELTRTMPQPTFNAGPRHRDLDHLERE
jgi:tRNA (guanine-N7-)-methyltransferase